MSKNGNKNTPKVPNIKTIKSEGLNKVSSSNFFVISSKMFRFFSITLHCIIWVIALYMLNMYCLKLIPHVITQSQSYNVIFFAYVFFPTSMFVITAVFFRSVYKIYTGCHIKGTRMEKFILVAAFLFVFSGFVYIHLQQFIIPLFILYTHLAAEVFTATTGVSVEPIVTAIWTGELYEGEHWNFWKLFKFMYESRYSKGATPGFYADGRPELKKVAWEYIKNLFNPPSDE